MVAMPKIHLSLIKIGTPKGLLQSFILIVEYQWRGN